MTKHLISVIVPAYKQEKTIYQDLKQIHSVLADLRYPSELICVVDGYKDNTLKAAQRFARKHHQVKVVGYEINRGKGHAIRFGINESQGDIVGFIDAGMDLNPNALRICLEYFEWYNADAIIGSKRHPASKVNYPWQRRILSFGYQLLIKALFGLQIKDTQVGIKLYRKEILERILPKLVVDRFAFDIELLSLSYYFGYTKIFEAPVEMKLDFGGTSGITSQRFIRTVLKMLWDTLIVYYRLKILGFYSDSAQPKWRLNLSGLWKQLAFLPQS